MRSFKLFIFISLAFLASSCKYGKGPQLMPNVSGKANEVVIVIGKGEWEGEIGANLRSILAKDEPFLPQKEPMFTLVNIPESAFSRIFQTHRNIIKINITPKYQQEPIILFQENVWAAPQIVATITGANSADVAKLIEEQSDRLSNAILMAERNRNIQNAKRYEAVELRRVVTEDFGGSPFFPRGYSLKKRSRDFIWISYETTYTNQGLFIYRYPFRDSSDFTVERLINIRNQVLYQNVPGQIERSYMTTSQEMDPALRWIRYNRRDFAEVRGLWEVENDFMGGPFISHFFLDKERENIIVLEAFVYAPRYDKRNYLRQVESLIYSFQYF